MKKIVLIVFLGLITLGIAGCSTDVEDEKVESEKVPKNAETMNGDEDYKFETDPTTGVEYIIYNGNKQGGITTRVDKSGKPIINPQWQKDHQKK